MANEADSETELSAADEAYRLYTQARAALDKGDREAGIRLLRQAGSLAPHFKTFELLGEALIEHQEYREAVMYLAAAVGLGNKPFRAHYLLARALMNLRPAWVTDATEQLQRALQVNPNYKAARALLDELVAHAD
jgi:hypothetical protein